MAVMTGLTWVYSYVSRDRSAWEYLRAAKSSTLHSIFPSQQALEPEGFGILLGSGILLGIKQLKVDCNRITSSEFVNLMQSVLVIGHKRR